MTLNYTHFSCFWWLSFIPIFPAPTQRILVCWKLSISQKIQIWFRNCNRLKMSRFIDGHQILASINYASERFSMLDGLCDVSKPFSAAHNYKIEQEMYKGKEVWFVRRGPTTIQWTPVFSWKLFSRSSWKMINGNWLSGTLKDCNLWNSPYLGVLNDQLLTIKHPLEPYHGENSPASDGEYYRWPIQPLQFNLIGVQLGFYEYSLTSDGKYYRWPRHPPECRTGCLQPTALVPGTTCGNHHDI